MAPKHQRLAFAVIGLIFLIAGSLLLLNRFSEHLVFFYTPSQLLTAAVSETASPKGRVRMGGLVLPGSLQQSGMHYQFIVTDNAQQVAVAYDGIPPSLFREGQGVVVEGVYAHSQALFTADRLLAKHDENYMPPEVAKALKENGYWKDGDAPHPASPAPNPLLMPDITP